MLCNKSYKLNRRINTKKTVDFVELSWYYNGADSETHWVGDFRWGWILNLLKNAWHFKMSLIYYKSSLRELKALRQTKVKKLLTNNERYSNISNVHRQTKKTERWKIKWKKLLTNNWVSDKIIESLLNRATQKNIDNWTVKNLERFKWEYSSNSKELTNVQSLIGTFKQ